MGATPIRGTMTMTLRHLMVLLELDDGCYHAAQCGRSNRNKDAAVAFAECEERGLIRLIGDEYFLTTDGNDVLEVALAAGSRQLSLEYRGEPG